MAWHRITGWRANYDWLRSIGHILFRTPEGDFDTTALKADEFHAICWMLRTFDTLYTDGKGRVSTGDELPGVRRVGPAPPASK